MVRTRQASLDAAEQAARNVLQVSSDEKTADLMPCHRYAKADLASPTLHRHLTLAGLDLADRLLALNPALRPSADEALSMPYFVSESPKPELPDV